METGDETTVKYEAKELIEAMCPIAISGSAADNHCHTEVFRTVMTPRGRSRKKSDRCSMLK